MSKTVGTTTTCECGKCGKVFERAENEQVMAFFGEPPNQEMLPICPECYRPHVLRLSHHELRLLHELRVATRYLKESLEYENSEFFDCDCNPEYESDTNAWNHNEEKCASFIGYHIDAVIDQSGTILKCLPEIDKKEIGLYSELEKEI